MPRRDGGGNWNASEAAFQEQVLALARLYQWRCYHTHDSRRSQPGFPDLVMVRPPRLVFAELKTEKGRVGREQAAWLAALGDVAEVVDMLNEEHREGPFGSAGRDALATVEVYLWRPSDLQRIAETLAGAGIDPEIGRAYARERMP